MGPVRIALAAAAVAVAVAACSGPATSHAVATPATYYLALGDSLSQGVQPDAAGTSVETGQGYADQLYAMLRPSQPTLQLVKLGCPGETTATMIHGGICHYPGGSQLAAAVAFLTAHRGHVRLVTIDIGANDPEDCGSWANLRTVMHCVGTNFPDAVSNLDASSQLFRIERLGHEIVCSGIHGLEIVGLTLKRSEEDEIGVIVARQLADLATESQSVHFRHQPV